MRIEFDADKRRRSLDERGLDFSDAGTLFASGDFIERVDDRRDYGERRLIRVAELHGRVTVVVWTPRGDAVRVISMRIAHDDEREEYWRQLDRSG